MVAEHANRTLDEGVIALLKEAGLPPIFWGEALACFVHTRNRCPPIQHPMSSGMALNQLWNTLGYLDPLPGFILGRTRGRSNHTIKCRFLSYPTGYKGWKFWDPVGKKCIISRDVIFDERPLHPATSTPPTPTSPNYTISYIQFQLHSSYLTIPTILHQNYIFLVHFLMCLLLSVGVPLLLLHSIQWELTRMSSHLHTILHHLQHLPLEELPDHLSLQQSGGRMLLIISRNPESLLQCFLILMMKMRMVQSKLFSALARNLIIILRQWVPQTPHFGTKLCMRNTILFWRMTPGTLFHCLLGRNPSSLDGCFTSSRILMVPLTATTQICGQRIRPAPWHR
jgi:hypothetical protein